MRVPEVQKHLDERNGEDRQKIPRSDDRRLSFPLNRQNQQNLPEWAVKGAMINDAVDLHPRFFTDAECYAFKQKRTIPDTPMPQEFRPKSQVGPC